jgi:hypothetical protein
MQIDESDEELQNADLSIRDSCEPGSNVTVESDLHPEKQYSRSVRTEGGIQIDDSDGHS